MRKTFLRLLVIAILVIMGLVILFIGCLNNSNREETGSAIASTEEVKTEEEIPEIVIADIKSISVEEVYEIIQNREDYFIVDVRTEEEYTEGHLEEALLLPVQELEDRLGELPGDKPIIVYCRSGGRSRTAAEILVNNGFTQVHDMGGISVWIDKGYLVVTE